MIKKLSKNVQNIEISGIRKFFNKVSEVSGAISLTLGQPDFSVPLRVKEAIIKALMENKTGYTSNAGIIELRMEISKYLEEFEIKYTPDEVCLTIGGSEAILVVFSALLNPKDKVLTANIAYPAYDSTVKLLGGETIYYKLKDDFSIDFEDLERKIIEEKPKLLVVSYPSNPTGAVLSKTDKEKLHLIVKNNDVIVITDEIYGALCYNDYYSIAQYEDIKNKIIFISGFSKTFSMTGLRLGYLCAPEEYMSSIMKVHQYAVSCAPSIVQWGALEGLKYCKNDVLNMKNEFIRRRDYVYKRLLELGFEVNMPGGAFYIFPSIKKFNMTSEDFCEKLLREAKIAIVPGSAFGPGGEGYTRLSYSYSMEELEKALNRLAHWLKGDK